MKPYSDSYHVNVTISNAKNGFIVDSPASSSGMQKTVHVSLESALAQIVEAFNIVDAGREIKVTISEEEETHETE